MGLIDKRKKRYKSVDNYLKELWRPMMAWFYAIIVLFDFLVAPILLGIYTINTKQNYIPWQPLTIQGGGMFHVAMGAVLGISAWSRGREKERDLYAERRYLAQDYDDYDDYNSYSSYGNRRQYGRMNQYGGGQRYNSDYRYSDSGAGYQDPNTVMRSPAPTNVPPTPTSMPRAKEL